MHCDHCPLKDRPTCKSKLVPGARFVVVGEAPGETETYTDEPFTGSSGRVLRAVLRQALRVEEDDFLPVSFTNTISCRPEGNADPPTEATLACASRLVADLRAQQEMDGGRLPVVLAVGRHAVTRFVGQTLVKKILASRSVWDGYVYLPGRDIRDTASVGTVQRPGPDVYKSGPRKGQPKPVRGPAFVPTGIQWIRGVVGALHPAAVMRTGFKDILRLQVAAAMAEELADGAVPYTGPAADSFVRSLGPGAERVSNSRCVAFDIENPDRVNIAQIGFASDEGPVVSVGWSPQAKAFTKKLLEGDGGPVLIAHNAQYDVAHLRSEGIEVNEQRLVDTMLAAQLLQPDLPKGLGKVAQRYLLLTPWKHLDEEDLALYNAMDADVTVRMWKQMERQLERTGQLGFFRDVIMPGSMTLRRLTQRGIRVSGEALAGWRRKLEGELQQLQEEWEQLTTDITGHAVNPGSPVQLAELLFNKLQLPVVARTKSGAPSTSKGALAKLQRRANHPAVSLLLRWRERAKELGTYAKDQGVGPDGCVHPQYLPEGKDDGEYGTASLRLAARNPNIQNQPQSARFQYVPHHYGWVIVETDFSQIEGRLVAQLSGAEELIEAYETGADIHQSNAELWGVERSVAKGILYAMQYGAGAGTLSQQFEVPLNQARGWLKAYEQAHPKVAQWQRDTIRKAATYGYLQNDFGIRRYFPGLSRDDAHVRNQALNFLPQALVAGIMWTLLAPLEQLIEEEGGHLLTQVHDSFLWEAPGEKAERMAQRVQAAMERPFDEVAPGWRCPTDSSVGQSWGHAGLNDKAASGGASGLDVWVAAGRPCFGPDQALDGRGDA